jgi:hypothetical protein
MIKVATIALVALLMGTSASAPCWAQSSSEKVRDNPAAQYVLVKTIVNQSIGIVNTRALPVEAGGYNLLKYCWTPFNVLGDWGDRSGLPGEMIVRALETSSWTRDLVRAGYPQAPVVEAVGRYEAALVAAGFADAARTRALDGFVNELAALRIRTPGAAEIRAAWRCDRQPSSLGLNHATAPQGGEAQFIPFLLHRLCGAQQIDADDPARCDYWMPAKPDGPMSFATETVYNVRWPDGTIGWGRFNPDEQRSAGTVTLRERSQKK